MTTVTLPATREAVDAIRNARVPAALGHAWRSPFFRARLRAAGIEAGEVPTDQAWARITPTTKAELRELSTEQFREQLVVAEPNEIALYWRSGAVTGRPLFYPKTHADLPELVESFARVLDIVGLGPGDLVHNSFPYLGVHPIGHMFGHALRERGVGNIFAGSGANTPTDAQVRILFDLRATAWMGIGSYLNHLGHRAETLGYDPAAAGLRRTISSAEPLTPAKRARMQDVWGAELFDCYGMTECSLMGAECAHHDGLHIWTDMFAVEILNPDGQPVPAGEVGDVVVTPLHSASSIPFLRWVSGDRGSLEADCDCQYAMFPRLKLTDGTVGFIKVRGVNINHSELQDKLLTLPAVADYMVTVVTEGTLDRLGIEIEIRDASEPQVVADVVLREIGATFEVRPEVTLLARGTIAARLEGEVKQVRVRDLRSQ